MKILVLNSGSSSLKYKLLSMPEEELIASGRVERIGESGQTAKFLHTSYEHEFEDYGDCPTHRHALEKAFQALCNGTWGCLSDLSEIDAVGHRLVHGKDEFSGPTLLDEKILDRVRSFAELAPLHMPANISCIDACRELLPEIPQVALFDTGFFQNMPEHSRLYAVPMRWHDELGVKRYGFHGISHEYVTHRASEMLSMPLSSMRLITLHLGNGASMTAFTRGQVFDTSMGFTPLEGLMMGTRAGHLDPAVIPYVMSKTGASAEEVIDVLNNQSGMEGISGVGRDMRAILDARSEGNRRADLAWRMYVHTIRKYLGGYFFAMGGADAIAFAGGIGENSPEVRAAVLEELDCVGIVPDHGQNMAMVEGASGFISRPSSPVKVLVVPTDEELMIAGETFVCLTDPKNGTHD
jgi:acetate kinase